MACNTCADSDFLTALLVEDDLITREDLALGMKARFKSLHLAENGREALRLFTIHRPHIVISDIRMPSLDGLELARHIRSMAPEVPIIIASAYGDEKTLLSAINIGVDRFIRKPVVLAELLEAVDACAVKVRGNRDRDDSSRYPEALLDHAPEFLLTTDGRNVRYLNQPLSRYLLLENADPDKVAATLARALAFHRNDREWAEGGSGDDHAGADNVLLALAQRPGVERLVTLSKPGRSARLTCLARVARLPVEDPGEVVVSLADVTGMARERDFYLQLAVRDPLTGIYNRMKFDEELEQEVERARRYESRMSVIMMDIDDFKQVNDLHGHQAGDAMLVELATLIADSIRKVDVFARYGGEEFFLLCPEVGIEGAMATAEKIRKLVASHGFRQGGRLSLSLGVAEYRPGEKPGDLTRRADKALYRAKAKGKNSSEADS